MFGALQLGLGLTRGQDGGALLDPDTLFDAGTYDGFVHDFSRLGQMWQERSAQTVVSANGNPVGRVMDGHTWGGLTYSQYRDQAAEIVTNGDFESATGWSLYAGVTIAGGKLNFASAANGSDARQTGKLTAYETYFVEYEVDSFTAGTAVRFFTVAATGVNRSAAGVYNEIFSGNVASGGLGIQNTGTTTAVLDNMSVKHIPGNHAVQATAGSRPLLVELGALRGNGSSHNLLSEWVCGSSGNSMAARVSVPVTLAATQIVLGASGSATARFFVGFNTSGHLVGGVGDDDVDVVLHAHDYRGEVGTLALVEDGDDWFLYWEGVEVATGTLNGAPTTTIPWRLLALNNNGTAGSFSASDMSHAFGIDRALTASEVRQLSDTWRASSVELGK